MIDVPRVAKTKTGKTVRIISPHSATSDSEDGRDLTSTSRVLKSPLPNKLSPESPENKSSADPFGAESDGDFSTDDENTRQNTLGNSGYSTPRGQGTKAVPANPFAKTLASLNAESQPSPESQNREQRPLEMEPKAAKSHYDVDDFKRLLLKGEKNIASSMGAIPPTVSFQGQHGMGDSSSATDTSSVSRQSIFEPISNVLQESPRTSYESLPADDEREQLAGSLPSTLMKTKPAVPRSRHGKLVKPASPQVVSFEDPTLSLPESAISPANPTPELSMMPNNGSKSLPSALDSTQSSAATSPDAEIYRKFSYSTPPETQGSPNPQKRNAPAPPLSRRHSLRPKSFVASERSTPISEEDSLDSFPLSQSPPNTASKFPPTPPPRRTGQARGESPSSVSMTISALAIRTQPNDDDASIESTKSRPPTPPNRSPSLSAIKRQSTQPFTSSPSMAPPPPPRRRGSSASSFNYNPSRLSGNYSTMATERIRSDSNASLISQLPMSSPIHSNAEGRDVMADLSALQREVDELRGKFAT